MRSLDRLKIGFQPLTDHDLPALHRWLNTPHVLEWWDNPGPSYEQVVEKYAPRIREEQRVECYTMLCGGEEIGFIQAYDVEVGSEYAPYVPDPRHAMGVDLFIGEKTYLHRGLGSRVLCHFVREVIFERRGADTCVIDPSVRNRIAIRAYEKAGFQHVATFRQPEEPDDTYLMVLNRAE